MKTRIQKNCLTIILFSVCFHSCKKNSHDPRPPGDIYVTLSTEALEYVHPALNKYFIYKDSSSSKLDSVVVTKSLLDEILTPGFLGGPLAHYQFFSLTLTKFDTGAQTVWEIDFQSSPAFPSVSLDNQPVEIVDTSGVLSFYYPVCKCDSSTAIPGLTVEGKSYNNVIRTIADNGADPSSPDYRRAATYWAKGVGIIKRIKTTGSDTKTYFLIRNN